MPEQHWIETKRDRWVNKELGLTVFLQTFSRTTWVVKAYPHKWPGEDEYMELTLARVSAPAQAKAAARKEMHKLLDNSHELYSALCGAVGSMREQAKTCRRDAAYFDKNADMLTDWSFKMLKRVQQQEDT